MHFLFLSTHAFLPTTRKASVHFVVEALAARGNAVDTVSVGFSLLTALTKPRLFGELAVRQRNRFVQTGPRRRSACYLPPLHPFSSRCGPLNRANALFFPLFGNRPPRFMTEAIERADVVVIESGTAIAFFDAVRRINPRARTLYFKRDRLDTVGASAWLQAHERRIAPQFDRVVVPSPRMAEHLPAGCRMVYVPQGIDKAGFDACVTSPYPDGSRNAVSVGDMLFDAEAVAAMARSSPDVRFHLFGAGIQGAYPPNVHLYGERAYGDIVPYIKFADFGIAPYRLGERELYLAESSLKLQQYSYCRLPILAPDLLAGGRANLVGYDQHDERDWAGKVRRAATIAREPGWRDGILSWDEVAARIEAEAVSS
ncbi:GumK N-terminal domain-containing glycosyltransferase [Mycoplana dimorpha]|uniref:2-beta-glucuronyltransferase n=1 Tax=Mycoplana dimorpha TaxID=28320 RepID=A0A2T5B653_MYCDI|nr:polysaccharide biosynthesis protein GumK [Mycoplana dimorpha]PTM94404.1 2-beta-glucuronyltransferase [Mycoplana dimorpha]